MTKATLNPPEPKNEELRDGGIILGSAGPSVSGSI